MHVDIPAHCTYHMRFFLVSISILKLEIRVTNAQHGTWERYKKKIGQPIRWVQRKTDEKKK